MPRTISVLDRLRIERLVWALDQRLYDLPRASRIANRREVRVNLLAAAGDVGATQALRRLGGSQQLAERYLTAEYGDGPRHSWIGAAYFCGLFPLMANFCLDEAAMAYQDAITAVDPHATGTFTWSGISYLQHPAIYTFVQGDGSRVGGDWTLATYALWIVGTILVGRLWRLLPRPTRGRRLVPSA